MLTKEELLGAAEQIQDICRDHTRKEGKRTFLSCAGCDFRDEDGCIYSSSQGEPLYWRIKNA